MVVFTPSTYTFKDNKTTDVKVFVSNELVSNGRYFSPYISYKRWYVNTRYGNIERILSLINVIQSDI